MRELKQRFKKGSRTYTQLHRQEEDFYIYQVLREHFDYTDQEIRKLVSGNPKLAHLGVLVDNYPTEGEKSDLKPNTEGNS